MRTNEAVYRVLAHFADNPDVLYSSPELAWRAGVDLVSLPNAIAAIKDRYPQVPLLGFRGPHGGIISSEHPMWVNAYVRETFDYTQTLISRLHRNLDTYFTVNLSEAELQDMADSLEQIVINLRSARAFVRNGTP